MSDIRSETMWIMRRLAFGIPGTVPAPRSAAARNRPPEPPAACHLLDP